MAGTESIERLVRELYGLAAIRRDAARRAFSAQAIQGLSALWAVEQLGRAGSARSPRRCTSTSPSPAGRSLRWPRPATSGASATPRTAARTGSRSPPTGEAALAAAHAKMVGAFASAVESWGDDDVLALAGTLERLREDYATAVAREALEVAR